MKRAIVFLLLFTVLLWNKPLFALTPDEEKQLFQILGRLENQVERLSERIDLLQNQIILTNKRIDDLRAEMNARFAEIDKRFEQIDKRFEQVERRFEQVDKRFEQVDTRFEQVDRRFEQIDKRFEQMDSRFSELITYVGWIVGGLFGLVAVFVALLLWDRRTAVISAVRTAEKDLEQKYQLETTKRILDVLRERAKTDTELANILRNFGMF